MTRFVALLSFGIALYAQDFRATLTGTVTDPSGAAIPGANVKVTKADTQEVKEAKTSPDGHYTLPYLNPGNFTVEVMATGFQTLKRENIVLRVADKVELPLQLTVGQSTTEITVTGQQEVLDTGDASRGLVFDPVKTQEYPLNGRQTYMLMSLTPGVLFTQETIGPGGFSGTRGWDVNSSYKINGARPGTNVFLLNGARISDNGGTWDLAPNVEAVQEFKVMTNTYDATYGGFGGGAVNTTLKSGTNEYHGDVFDYFRNNYFDANYFANNFNGQATPYHNQHQFGGIFGGPIRKNKTYFFGSFEGWREVLPAPALNTVPTLNERQGNFSADGYIIYDPLTSVACNTVAGCSNHTWVRSPFPGNTIPSNRIGPFAQKVLGFFPAPTTSALTNNFNAPNIKDQYMYNQPIVRMDHNFSDTNKLYGMVTWQHGTENRDSTGFGPPANSGNINNARTDQNYIVDFTHIVSSTTVFDARLSFGRFTQSDPNVGDPSFKASNLGFSDKGCAPTISLCNVPRFQFGNSIQSLFGNQQISWYSFNTWDFTPSLTMNRGRHTLKVGMEVLYQARPSQSSGSAAGDYTFNTSWTQHYSDQQQNSFDGNSIATMMLGYIQSGSIDYNSSVYITRPYLAGFVQDDWKVSNRLTVNLGLRYEMQIPWKERYNRGIRGFDFNSVNPFSAAVLANWNKLAATYNAANPNDPFPYPAAPANLYGGLIYLGQNGASERAYDTNWRDLGPRIGIAYRLGDKTVLRAGAGVFYRQQQNNLSTQYGYSQTSTYNNSTTAGQFPSACDSGGCANGFPTGPYSIANTFPGGLLQPYGNTLGLGSNLLNNISINNPNYRTPRTYQYSLGLQRELPGSINLEVSYAGNREIFVPVGYNMSNSPNSVTQLNQFFANSNLSSKAYPNPYQGILPAVFGSTATNPTISYGNLTRNWPLFTQLTQNYIQIGHYRSDQLQVKAEKRLGGDKTGVFTWVLSYTFGKQLQADHRLNNWNTAEDPIYEIDDGTKVHDLAFSAVWDLPLGKGQHFLNSGNKVVNQIVSNWRLSPIFTWSTGFPLGFVSATNYCGSFKADGITFADGTTGQNENHWFNNNKNCYAALPNNILNFYQDRFSYIFQPQGPQLNAALEKTIVYKERYKVQLRGEAFNATNTPIRANPSTTFTNTLFGQLPKSTKNQPRVLQIAAKFIF